MTIGIYIKKEALEGSERTKALCDELSSQKLYRIRQREDLLPGTDLVLSLGGDGTFLSASKRVADSGVPILGVNFGRLGFLSGCSPELAARTILGGDYEVEDRTMLRACVGDADPDMGFWPYALNEVTVHRLGAAVLGINVSVGGQVLPTYWADGLIVATSSGSTAYSLSAGGPICMPDARVLVIAPIAPHNLNVRPLVVPEESPVSISFTSRDGRAMLSLDNRNCEILSGQEIRVTKAEFPLRRIRPLESNFVGALTGKLFWGEDIRNNS